MLEIFQNYFQGGYIAKVKKDNTLSFVIDTENKFVKVKEHFDKYPLLTRKFKQYKLTCEIFDLLLQKAHLTSIGFQKILQIKKFFFFSEKTKPLVFSEKKKNINLVKNLECEDLNNFVNTLKIKGYFGDVISKDISLISDPKIIERKVLSLPINAFWLAGFTTTDGSFGITLRKVKKKFFKIRFSVEPFFSISQHQKDKDLLLKIKEFLNIDKEKLSIDKPSKNIKRTAINLRFFVLKGINEIIIPFFDKYPVSGAKFLDYLDWKKCITLINNKEHLIIEGYQKIEKIRSNMNQRRKIFGKIIDK